MGAGEGEKGVIEKGFDALFYAVFHGSGVGARVRALQVKVENFKLLVLVVLDLVFDKGKEHFAEVGSLEGYIERGEVVELAQGSSCEIAEAGLPLGAVVCAAGDIVRGGAEAVE